MKTLLNILVFVLLFINGTGALYGGWNLIMHPDGGSIQLSKHWLDHTPFTNYLIPGIILFMANGVFSVIVIVALLAKHQYVGWLVIAQGAILVGWIIIQILLIQTTYFLHIIMSVIGMGLILAGWLQQRSIKK